MGTLPERRPATYADVLAAPEHMVAEVLDGELHTSPRPSSLHARASSRLGSRLGPPFDDGMGGPGGWIILFEPELHLGPQIVVPDLAGWRRGRMPELADTAYFTLAPDWTCEVLSPSTERIDRLKKLRIYAATGVVNAWLVSPQMRSLEVYRLADGHFALVATHSDEERVGVEPFAEVEIDLGGLWAR